MILFAGIPSEPPLALAIEAADRRGIAYAIFNQRHSRHCDLSIESHDEFLRGTLLVGDTRCPLECFTGIYARTVDPCSLPEHQPQRGRRVDPDDRAKSIFLSDAFNDWLEVSPSCVVNRPSAACSNSSKPYQAQIISGHGFLIPPTLITNDPALVKEFRALHGRIIYKSTSAVRSIVSEWLPSETSRLRRLHSLPTQFQALIPGTNVRVHVIADQYFATEIVSDSVDYRYTDHEGGETALRSMSLPTDVAAKCISMTRSLGLAFSGIDLKRTPDGRWFCFEVNTSPGYSFFQQHSGQPIADALVSALSNG
jgi:glutathione synthase/RimK-type ligase-like ATP-grasp enzyme